MYVCVYVQGFPGGICGKEPACQGRNIREMSSIPGLGSYPGGGNGNPPQYSYLENLVNRGAWWATVHRVCKELDVTEATWHHTYMYICLYICVCVCVCVCIYKYIQSFPGGTSGKNLPANAGDIRDTGSIPGLGRSRGGGHSNPL